jgi:hypothetical protein
MKKIKILFIGVIILLSGCDKYLDINDNPNGPASVTPYLYLGPMQQQMAYGVQWDARFMGYYTLFV